MRHAIHRGAMDTERSAHVRAATREGRTIGADSVLTDRCCLCTALLSTPRCHAPLRLHVHSSSSPIGGALLALRCATHSKRRSAVELLGLVAVRTCRSSSLCDPFRLVMGQQLSRLSESISGALLSSLDASPAYRRRLMQLLQTYTADRSLSDAQVLQWSAEKLVADATNQSHELGARFLPALAAIDLQSFDATTVTQCIAQAAMQFLEGPPRTRAANRRADEVDHRLPPNAHIVPLLCFPVSMRCATQS